jgi:hypothetical protein
MQTGNAARLRLLCAVPGGRWLEHVLQRSFSSIRIDGEWYQPAPLLMNLIEELSLANERSPETVADTVCREENSSMISTSRH